MVNNKSPIKMRDIKRILISLSFVIIVTHTLSAQNIGYQDTVYGGYDIAVIPDVTDKRVLRTYNFKTNEEDSIKFGRGRSGFDSPSVRILNIDPDVVLFHTTYSNDITPYTHAIYIINIENMTVTDSIIGKGFPNGVVLNSRKLFSNKKDTMFAHYLEKSFEVNRSQKLDYMYHYYLGQLSIDGFYSVFVSDNRDDIFLTSDDTFLYSRFRFYRREIAISTHINEFGRLRYKFKSGDIGIFTSKEMIRTKMDIKLLRTELIFPEKCLTIENKDEKNYYREFPDGAPFLITDSSIKLNRQYEQGITHSIGFYEPEDYAEYQEPLPQEANAFAFDIFTGDTIDLFNRTLPIESNEFAVVFRRDEYPEQDYWEWLDERKLREIQNKWGIVWY